MIYIHSRLVGVQFPPWHPTENPDIWGVQHLMHPDLHEPVFAEWYGSPKLQEAVCQLLGTKPEELQLGMCTSVYYKGHFCILTITVTELFNLLVNPKGCDYDLTWHRDGVAAEATEEKEQEILKFPHYGTQWNTYVKCLIFI